MEFENLKKWSFFLMLVLRLKKLKLKLKLVQEVIGWRFKFEAENNCGKSLTRAFSVPSLKVLSNWGFAFYNYNVKFKN